MRNINNAVWKVLGLVISISLAVFLLTQFDAQEFLRIVSRVSIWSLLAALASYLLLNYFRLLRFKSLLNQPDIPTSIFYPIVLYHNFLVRTLPFKTGELSYIVLLRQRLNQPIREGVSSLVTSRLFELFMVIIVGGGALLLASDHSPLSPQLAVLIVTVGAIILLASLYFSGDLLRVIARVVQRVRATGLPGRLAQRLLDLAEPFDRMRQPTVFRSMLGYSVLTYSMSVSFNLVLVYAVGINISFGVLIGIISIVMLTDALPLATISGLGIVEGGWTFGLVLFGGLGETQAVSLGFFLHGCQLLAAITTGILGYLWLQRWHLQPE
jgi:uncharacterized membrane protein YbhN (UPF0104 family)